MHITQEASSCPSFILFVCPKFIFRTIVLKFFLQIVNALHCMIDMIGTHVLEVTLTVLSKNLLHFHNK